MTRIRYPLVIAAVALAVAAPAAAQNYSVQKPRRQFVTVSYDWMNTAALHFADHPLEDLVGRPVASAQNELYDYRTRDEAIQIDVIRFRKRNRGVSGTLYPFGLSSGFALGLRASIEELPIIKIEFTGAGAPAPYSLSGARAYDAGVGLFIADRSTGWGLGSQAFIVAGAGRIKADGRDGSRMFAEGGGGLLVGPLGVQLAVKFAWNKLNDPVTHRFLTIPLTVRGTFSF
ncbi:MAG: hypothetical protein ABIP65_11840 [Vicinamibacterales bacterium]